MFYERNAIWLGILVGLAIPFVGYATLLMIFDGLDKIDLPSFRVRTTAIIALCLNLIPMQWYRRRRCEETMKGIIVSTLIYAVLWVVYFGKEIFSQ